MSCLRVLSGFAFRFVVGLFFVVAPNVGEAATWYVDADNASATKNGLSWATAFATVQQGVNAAQAGDEVWVAEGTYTQVGGAAQAAGNIVVMKTSVHIYGGFSGTETLRSERDWKNNLTILDALDVSGRRAVAAANNATLDGFTLKRGRPTDQGGAIYCDLITSLAIRNCLFEDNYASASGGALFVWRSQLIEISNCSFESNTAANLGGALYIQDTSGLDIDSNTISGNSSGSDGAAYTCGIPRAL